MRDQNVDRRVPWYKLGACRGMDTDLFFPGRGEKTPDEVVEACSSCTVRKECETAGQAEFGVWGGFSERARRRTRRVRRKAAEEKSASADPLHEDDPSPAGERASRLDSSSAA